MTKVEAIKANETISITYPGYKSRKADIVVKAPCANKNNGQWYCATCDEFFEHNMSKDNHLSENPKILHRMAWNCFEHGIEQP